MNLLKMSLFLELKTEFLTDCLESGDAVLESINFLPRAHLNFIFLYEFRLALNAKETIDATKIFSEASKKKKTSYLAVIHQCEGTSCGCSTRHVNQQRLL